MTVVVRAAVPDDLPEIARMCEEHAAYEKATIDARDLHARLKPFLFSPAARAWCAVSESAGDLCGYATWSREFSTWSAAEYVHMDCLYVRAQWRKKRIGAQLIDFVMRSAAELRCPFVEWQTPAWNTGAMRFYDRLGARGAPKLRYRQLVRQ